MSQLHRLISFTTPVFPFLVPTFKLWLFMSKQNLADWLHLRESQYTKNPDSGESERQTWSHKYPMDLQPRFSLLEQIMSLRAFTKLPEAISPILLKKTPYSL
jgi:hypothetical protein